MWLFVEVPLQFYFQKKQTKNNIYIWNFNILLLIFFSILGAQVVPTAQRMHLGASPAKLVWLKA